MSPLAFVMSTIDKDKKEWLENLMIKNASIRQCVDAFDEEAKKHPTEKAKFILDKRSELLNSLYMEYINVTLITTEEQLKQGLLVRSRNEISFAKINDKPRSLGKIIGGSILIFAGIALAAAGLTAIILATGGAALPLILGVAGAAVLLACTTTSGALLIQSGKEQKPSDSFLSKLQDLTNCIIPSIVSLFKDTAAASTKAAIDATRPTYAEITKKAANDKPTEPTADAKTAAKAKLAAAKAQKQAANKATTEAAQAAAKAKETTRIQAEADAKEFKQQRKAAHKAEKAAAAEQKERAKAEADAKQAADAAAQKVAFKGAAQAQDPHGEGDHEVLFNLAQARTSALFKGNSRATKNPTAVASQKRLSFK
jgi:flagellar biosynthesis GTPase FlhF